MSCRMYSAAVYYTSYTYVNKIYLQFSGKNTSAAALWFFSSETLQSHGSRSRARFLCIRRAHKKPRYLSRARKGQQEQLLCARACNAIANNFQNSLFKDAKHKYKVIFTHTHTHQSSVFVRFISLWRGGKEEELREKHFCLLYEHHVDVALTTQLCSTMRLFNISIQLI